jgi:N-acyl homoserine lactone hydrolase
MPRGRPARLHVLDFGTFQVNAGRRIGIPGFLILTDAAEAILFDTRFPPAYGPDALAAGRADRLDGFGHLVGFGRRNLLAGQLALLGLTPADIALTILSHSHIDHVGGLAEVTHAPIVLTARDRAEPRPLYYGDARPLTWPEARYHTIAAATDLCPGLSLIPTPGHTPGHLSARLDLPRTGPVILAADALSRASEPAEGFPEAMHPQAAAASGQRLLTLARDTGAMLIYGHSPEQWPTLVKAPGFYD